MKRFVSDAGVRGVALVIVLWAVTLISAALIGLAALLQRQLGQEVAGLQNSRALLVAESGIQMALHPALFSADMDSASQQLSGLLQQGWQMANGGPEVRFQVRAEDFCGEEGRLNLNTLLRGDRNDSRRILTNLFAGWGVNATTSSAVIDALLDWTDPDDLVTGTDESTEDPGKVRNGLFQKLDEVEQVRGWPELTEEIRKGPNPVDWRSKLTVFGSGRLALLSADADVIEAWLDLSSGAAQNFVANRTGPDLIPGTQDDQVNLGLLPGNSSAWTNRITTDRGDLWRVTSTGYVGGVKRTLVALISRNPPLVRSRWVEENQP